MDSQLSHNQIKNSNHNKELIVISENLRTPENVGMMIRVAEAFGALKVITCGNSHNLTNKKVLRLARSCEKNILFDSNKDIIEAISQLRNDGYTLIGLEITQNSLPIQSFDFKSLNKIALIIGSERQGISDSTIKQLDHTVHFNLFGKNSSVNVINALSIGLYEITRLD